MGALDGQVAIVTGASRGLGKEIALSMARSGAIVVATARTEHSDDSRIPGSLQSTVELIKEAGGQALAVRCDVTREDEIEGVVGRTISEFGRVDILVNNAGILVPGTIMEMQLRHFDLAYRVNLRGPFVLCRAVIPHMARQGRGHIINVSSLGAIGPGSGPYQEPAGSGGTTYGATKAALERFSQGLAAEVFSDNIAVNVLSPHLALWSEGGHYFRTLGGDSPSYSGWRMSGEIIGDAAVFICTQDPRAFTGRILYDELLLREEGGLNEAEIQRRYPVQP